MTQVSSTLSNFGVFAAPDRRGFAIAGRDRDFTPEDNPRCGPPHGPHLP